MPERVSHYEAYLQKFSFINFPGLVDEGYGRDAVVSSKWNANYTTIVTVGIDGKVAYRKDFPNNFSGAYSGLDSKIEDLLDDIDSEPPDVSVSSPSSGDDLQGGVVHNVKWTATDNIGVVSRAIYFTADGSSWELVDSATGSTGTYSWTVPDDASSDCKIEVFAYDAVGNAGSDESSAFTITGTGIIHNVSEAGKLITISKNLDSYAIFIPFPGFFTVTISDVQGKQLTSFTTPHGRGGWYTVPKLSSSGMHIICIKTPERSIVKKFWLVR